MSNESLSHHEFKERLRTGQAAGLNNPGREEAARELFRPIIEQMRGREIIYRCRFP